MATLMQKDVLIEVVANALAIIDLRTEPTAEDNADQQYLSNLRETLYSLQPEEIDYASKLAEIRNIQEKYKNLPIHQYYA